MKSWAAVAATADMVDLLKTALPPQPQQQATVQVDSLENQA